MEGKSAKKKGKWAKQRNKFCRNQRRGEKKIDVRIGRVVVVYDGRKKRSEE